MKKLIQLTAGMLMVITVKAQQDPQYSLYQFNQLIINPAYAGARDGVSVVAGRRQQWLSFPGAPETTCLSVHGPILNKNLGIGLTVVNDKMGPRNVIGAYGNVAYILRLGQKMKLSFGFNAGYNRFQFNFNELNFQATELPPELYQSLTPAALDINSGIYLRSGSFFFGVSATHLNSPDVFSYESVNTSRPGKFTYKLNTHLFVTCGKSFVLSDNLVFSPTVLVKTVGSVTTGDINLNFFLHRKIWLGAYYRYGFGPGALLQYYITNRVRVGYSYDTGLQDARRLGGSHELMIGVDFAGNRTKTINPRFL
jgi:type IX secretion system PorP/SprF family membrane protein